MPNAIVIIGAGLAGALAGALEPEARIYEAGDGRAVHQAVLRFREPKIGRTLGIPFREVRVFKGVWIDGRCRSEVSPAAMNLYSRKVTGGRIAARSIADLSPVTRWVAPDDLHRQLLRLLRDRLYLASPITRITPNSFLVDGVRELRAAGSPIISTAPLKNMLEMLEPRWALDDTQFSFAGIHVARWRVPNCDVHQTVYFPEPDTPIYRATLTGEHLIIESMAPSTVQKGEDLALVTAALGLSGVPCGYVGTATQRFGKIVPIDPERRKRTLLKLTMEYGIYSLGRFACWRNILLDDVFEDLFKIRAMIHFMGNGYDLVRSVANES